MQDRQPAQRRSLEEIAKSIHVEADTKSKSVSMYAGLAPFLEHLASEPISLLEMGIHRGESLKIFASYFRNGKIIGLDKEDTRVDLSGFPNIAIEIGNQHDAAWLTEISDRHAPNGFDIVVDDASHRGAWSRLSMDALYPKLKPGGLYIVEDWGTGYMDSWADGGHYERYEVHAVGDHMPRRIPSHDFGMVGFVKSLIDDLSIGTSLPRRFDWMNINEKFAVLKKVSIP